ncbi:hypothetical protein [Lysinibacillus sp. FSL W8-0953]|uniref:hypothetical protein n=1 Tax=Lysinibacillus sp. FSL W8-0953 TaxID=2954640 RepID=UPI0030F6802B
MTNEYLIIQQKINHYSCYVKHLIVGFCEEFQTNKVHLRRVTSILERLFANESIAFLNYFVDEKFTVPVQFIHYLNAQGEIIHLGNTYYTLPPERSIRLPNGQYVSISSLQLNIGQLGIGQLTTHKLPISLEYDEYVFLPTFESILKLYKDKLSNHHDIEPSEMIFFNENGSFKSSKIKNMQDGEFYILKFERLIGSKSKPENYFAQWKNNEWLVAQIKNGMYTRVRMALRDRKNMNSNYKVIKHQQGFVEIKFQYSLPKEEEVLLRLIATPNESKWPKSYLTKENQLSNVRAILANCKLKELEVKNDGIHN